MLDKVLAARFIEKISSSTDYNVNIMNEKGIIIASKDIERIGEFHTIAYRLLQSENTIASVSGNTPESRYPGFNMVLEYRGKRIGVIGMTGDPKEIEPILKVLKVSMETSLEYELYKEKIQQHKNMKEQFLNWILYGEDTGKREIHELAKQLGYCEDIIRIPILIVCHQDMDMDILLSKIKNSTLHSKEDISTVTRENAIVIFKYLKEEEILNGAYKYLIEEYLDHFVTFLKEQDISCTYYIGTLQNSLEHYRKAYQHCLWLKDSIVAEEQKLYFYDYVENYMQSLIPMEELNSIYHIFASQLDAKTQKEYVEVIEKLQENNYNLFDSSQKLFIHKNTLVFRLNKIKECFDMNPLQKQKDRIFLQYLCSFLKNK